MSLKEHLIGELKQLQRVIKSAPENLRAVTRAGRIVTALRDQFRVPDDEMRRILGNNG